jgi:murein L,D-transpeptidase YafK
MLRSLFSSARILPAAIMAVLLAGCMASHPDRAPIPRELLRQIEAMGSTPTAPIFVRIFKEESELEVWKQTSTGEYALLKTFAICAWSGELGPKVYQGDRQAPEGFYRVTPAQMNPNSDYHLAFNIGFPNTFDQSLGRTGSFLMVHGACSSAGCYAMTDEQVEVIYALAREAFRGGQRAFDVHAFPFRMTPENMALHRDNPNIEFWRMLQVGYDHFEATHRVPQVGVCDFGYVFDADTGGAALVPREECPEYQVPEPTAALVAARQETNAIAYAEAVARLEGVPMMAYAPREGPATVIPAINAAAVNATPVPAVAADMTALDALFQRLLGP